MPNSLTVTSFEPHEGSPNTVVTLQGTGFTESTVVRFNGVLETVDHKVADNGTILSCVVPQGATTGPLSLTDPGTQATVIAGIFNVTTGNLRVTSYTPTQGPEYTPVSITGSGFSASTQVSFGGVNTTIDKLSADGTMMDVRVPQHALSGPLMLSQPTTGAAWCPGNFTVTPTVERFQPPMVSPGAKLTVTGWQLADTTRVTFQGGAYALPGLKTQSSLQVTVPANAKSGKFTVHTTQGDATSPTPLTVQTAATRRSARARSGDALPILRHRPGRQTRMPDLKTRMAQNPASDPLSGNYTLVPLSDAIVGAPLSGSYGLTQLTATGIGLDAELTTIDRVDLAASGATLTTGDFDADGLDELIALCATEWGAQMSVCASREEGGVRTLSVVATVDAGVSGSARLASGQFLPGDAASLIVAHEVTGGYLRFDLWTFGDSLAPQRVNSYVAKEIELRGAFAVAAADVDQSGTSDIVVAFQGEPDAQGRNLKVALVSLDAAGEMTVDAPVALAAMASGSALALAAGPFARGSVDEQAVIAWSPDNERVRAAICSFDDDLTPVLHHPWDGDSDLHFGKSISVAAGDIDVDGVDEVIVGSTGAGGGSNGAAVLVILEPGADLSLSQTGKGALGFGTMKFPAALGQQVAIGNLGDNGTPAAVVAAAGYQDTESELMGDMRAWIAMVPVAPGGQLPPDVTSGLATSYSSALPQGQMASPQLTLGDFNGKSLRVGPPKYTSCDMVNNVIAIINAPPTEQGINLGEATVSFTEHATQTSSLGVTVHEDWSTSNTLSGSLGKAVFQVNASLSATYGQGFSKTEDSSTTLSESVASSVTDDDLIVLSATHCDVWEYPVYASAANTVQGHILVVFPDLLGLRTLLRDGSGPFVDYFPDHQPGVLMSYSPQTPFDVPPDGSGSINKPYSFEVGKQQIMYTVDWSSTTTESEQQHSNTALAVNAGATFSPTLNFLGGTQAGIQFHTTDTYTFGESTTQWSCTRRPPASSSCSTV